MPLTATDRRRLNMFYPHRPFPKGFCPSQGGHNAGPTNTASELCILEAISWSQGLGVTDSPLCVHDLIGSLFIDLNDSDYHDMGRSILFKIAHRALGTSYIRRYTLDRLSRRTLNHFRPVLKDLFPSRVFLTLDSALTDVMVEHKYDLFHAMLTHFFDSIDSWCKSYSPRLYAKRMEAIPLDQITPQQAEILRSLSTPITKRPTSITTEVDFAI